MITPHNYKPLHPGINEIAAFKLCGPLGRSIHFKMNRWANKVAVVTGASSGIGERICRDLCQHKVTVIGLARRAELLAAISEDIAAKNPTAGRFVGICCDVTSEEQLTAAFDRIIEEFGGVDILINNAGVFANANLLEVGAEDSIATMLQTNLSAVVSCTRRAFSSMAERDTDGYIVNISSVAGHSVPQTLAGTKPFPGAYFASKAALTAMNRSLGQELVFYQKPKIRITNLSPGVVQTEIFKTGGFGNAMESLPSLSTQDISDTLMFILATPSHVQVRDIVLESVGSCFY